MSTRGEINTLTRLAPEVSTGVISDGNLNLIYNKCQIDLSLRGRALPKNQKFATVTNQQEYVVSGASSVITANDFLAIDLKAGGLLFSDGTNWFGSTKEGPNQGLFEPKTKEWLDREYPTWRTNAGTTQPYYWYLDGDGSGNLVVGIVDKPSAGAANRLWLHYLSRGTLVTSDSNYFWTNSTSQLLHLEPYEVLFIWYALAYILRVILHVDQEANLYTQLYEAGVASMAARFPLADHLAREGFQVPGYFQSLMNRGGRRY